MKNRLTFIMKGFLLSLTLDCTSSHSAFIHPPIFATSANHQTFKFLHFIFKFVSFPLSFHVQIGNLTAAPGWKRFPRLWFEPGSDSEFVFAARIYSCICNLITSCHFSNGRDWVVLVNVKGSGQNSPQLICFIPWTVTHLFASVRGDALLLPPILSHRVLAPTADTSTSCDLCCEEQLKTSLHYTACKMFAFLISCVCMCSLRHVYASQTVTKQRSATADVLIQTNIFCGCCKGKGKDCEMCSEVKHERFNTGSDTVIHSAQIKKPFVARNSQYYLLRQARCDGAKRTARSTGMSCHFLREIIPFEEKKITRTMLVFPQKRNSQK